MTFESCLQIRQARRKLISRCGVASMSLEKVACRFHRKASLWLPAAVLAVARQRFHAKFIVFAQRCVECRELVVMRQTKPIIKEVEESAEGPISLRGATGRVEL